MDSSFWFDKLGTFHCIYWVAHGGLFSDKICIYFLSQKIYFVTANSGDLDENGGYLSKPLDSGKTFVDISFATGQICMGFEADTPENGNNVSILAIFGQRSG